MGGCFFEVVETLGVSLTDKQKRQFETYFEVLLEWNERMNLTSLTTKEDVYMKHFLDSLHMISLIDLKDQLVLDVGSGAGFPGMPLKIAFPDLKLTIVDALKKRIVFLETLCEKLGLKVELMHGRIEEHGLKNHYDIVTARAVAPLRILSELCLPFIAVGGCFIAYKSTRTACELQASENALKKLGGKLDTVLSYEVASHERTLIKVVKTARGSEKYPRPLHKIKKDPL